jgi:hypothetical protein
VRVPVARRSSPGAASARDSIRTTGFT